MNAPKNITGPWRGIYFYDLVQQQPPNGVGVGFELQLQQSWWQSYFGWFSGTVADDPPHGMPGAGQISGTFRGTTIRFAKRMPVSYILHNGHHVSLRDYLREHGHDIGYDVPHPSILYRGVFAAEDSATGTWRIPSGSLIVNSRLRLPLPGCTGPWKLTR